MTISRSCGDFSLVPAQGLSQSCIANNITLGGNLAWVVGMYAPGFCRLERGETYYLNLIHADLASPATSLCASNSCGNTIHNWPQGTVAWPN